MPKITILSSYNGKGVNSAIRSMQGLQSTAKKAGDDTAAGMFRAAEGLTRAGTSMSRMGSDLTRGVTLPLVAVGGAGVKAFKDFEDAMTKSTAIMTGVSDDTRKRMEGAARQVATTLSVSHKEAADSYYFLASAGLDAEQSISALPAVARFAQAGVLDMATATSLATNSQNMLGLASDDAAENLKNLTRVTDVLVGANTLADASVEEFASALTSKAGASMNEFSISMEQGVAVLGLFADKGLKGEAAGTTFTATLNGLTKAADTNADEFKKLGIEVFDSSGKLRDMGDIAADFEKALGGMSDQQRTAAYTTLGINKLTKDGINLMIGGSGTIKDYTKQLDGMGGVTERVANNQMESMNAQLGLAKDKFVDAGIAIGEQLAPHIVKLSEKATELANWFSNLDQKTQGNIVKFGLFAAALGPALSISGRFIVSLGSMVNFLGQVRLATTSAAAAEKASTVVKLTAAAATKAVTAAQWLLNAALSANPIGIVVVAIAALVAALIYAWNNSEKFREVVTKAWEAVKSAVGSVVDWFKTAIPAAFSAVLNFIKLYSPLGFLITNWDTIKQRMSQAATAAKDLVVNAFQRLKDGAVDKAQALVSWVTGLPGRITSALGNVANLLKDAGRNIINGLWDGLKAKWEDAKKWVTGIADWIRDNKGPKAYDLALLQPAGKWIMEGLVIGLDSQMNALEGKLRDVSATITGGVSGTANAMLNAAGGQSVSSGDRHIHFHGDGPRTYSEVIRALSDLEEGLVV